MKVQIHNAPNGGKAYIGELEAPEAEMTFSRAGEKMIIIDHTEVGENLRGKGAGRQLLLSMVDYARENNIKIIPLCPFAKSVFEKEPDIRDVLR